MYYSIFSETTVKPKTFALPFQSVAFSKYDDRLIFSILNFIIFFKYNLDLSEVHYYHALLNYLYLHFLFITIIFFLYIYIILRLPLPQVRWIPICTGMTQVMVQATAPPLCHIYEPIYFTLL